MLHNGDGCDAWPFFSDMQSMQNLGTPHNSSPHLLSQAGYGPYIMWDIHKPGLFCKMPTTPTAHYKTSQIIENTKQGFYKHLWTILT